MSLLAHHTGTLDFLKFSLGFQKNIVDDRHVIDNFNANNYFGVPKDSAKIFMNKSGNILNITIIGNPDSDTSENRNSTSLSFNNSTHSNDYDETSSKEISNVANDIDSVLRSSSSIGALESNLKGVANDHSIIQVSDLEKTSKNSNREHSIRSHSFDKNKNTSNENYGRHSYTHVNYGTIGDYYTVWTKTSLNGSPFGGTRGLVSGSQLDSYLNRSRSSWFNFVRGLNKVTKPILKPKDERIPTDCCLLACVEPTKYIYIP